MDYHNLRWLEHLDIVTAWGEASAANGTPPPTDDQLWAASRIRVDLNLPEQIDAELLAQLREAFNTGRNPTRIDLHAVASALHERGHDAVVEHTGGNTATLYAGRQVPDRYGDPRWSAAAGPGWYEAPGRREPWADTAEFAVGPDGDDTWAVRVPEHPTMDDLVNLVVAVIDEVQARRTRFAQAADAARDAMWSAFAAQYPEVTTGDLAPGADHAFVAESNKLLAGWLDHNWPGAHTIPATLATTPIADTTGDPRDLPSDTAAGPDPDGLIALVHSDVRVPHRRLRVTALHQLPTSDGVAFTAELRLDTTPVGTIENDGHGGETTFRSRHHDMFGWRQMQEYVERCRRHGDHVDEATLLNSLVDEFDLTAEITRAAKAGLTLVRLMDPQGRCLTIRAVAAVNTTRLTDLAVHLTNDPVAIPGGIWQIWSTGGWRHVATITDPQASHEKPSR